MFKRNKSLMRQGWPVCIVCGLLLIFTALFCYYYYRWRDLWAEMEPIPIYKIPNHHDDSLRIAIIGDSWACAYYTERYDTLLQSLLNRLVNRPVVCRSSGIGGAKTREVYQHLFSDEAVGSREVMLHGADYCIIFAGINDAHANLGVSQFLYYYQLILNLMLQNNVRPVVIEIPDVNLFKVYGQKPMKDLAGDFLKSCMTRCSMYNVGGYREALKNKILYDSLTDDVLYTGADCWNGSSSQIDTALFYYDEVHLNEIGYMRLNSCIAKEIALDLKNMGDTAFLNKPVDKNPKDDTDCHH